MTRHLFASAAAVALIGFAAAGCSKTQQAATSNAADTTTTAASNAADSTGNAVASAEASKPVSDVQDAASKAVGAVSASMPTNTQGFVDAAGMGDKFEITAAKLAEADAASPDVKAFAKQMVKDHTKTTTEIKGLISKGAVKATPPAELDNRRQGMVDNLKSAKAGAEFDTRYINQQVAAHEEMLTAMKGFADHGDNDALKAFAAKTAPTVQEHLDMAKTLQAKLKG